MRCGTPRCRYTRTLSARSQIEIPKPETCDIYIAGLGEKGSFKAFELASKVRTSGLIAETDVVGRGLRAQMKYADKIGAKFSMVLGDDEIENDVGKLKNMKTGETTEVSLDDNFLIQFQKAHVDYAFTINN